MFKKPLTALAAMGHALAAAAGHATSAAKELAAAVDLDTTAGRNQRYYGPAPRKFRVSGPPAKYPQGPAGDVARARAIRRF